MNQENHAALFERAKRRMPGGVNSPVRAFASVGGTPIFVREAHGATLVGEDGAEYVDYVGSWGPMIVGHAHPAVVRAIQETAARGTSFGAPTVAETTLAEEIAKAIPSIEMVRLVSSGTEAVMGALRAARGFTGRNLVVKFEGCYHGGADYLLTKAGSGLATLGVPSSAGIPTAIAATAITLPFNDLDAVRAAFSAHGGDIAALILEPVVGNMGLVPPKPGYLEGLRQLCTSAGVVLVFDEVMTGFRLAYGGAQERFGVTPDLTTLGKIVGGGLPLGAYGGAARIMSTVAPSGPVYQAGTLSGNPLATAAGLSTLSLLRQPEFYEQLEHAAASLEAMLTSAARDKGVRCVVQRMGSMITPFFGVESVHSWDDAKACDTKAFSRFHQALLASGVYWPPSQFEAAFVSIAHDNKVLSRTERAIRKAFEAL